MVDPVAGDEPMKMEVILVLPVILLWGWLWFRFRRKRDRLVYSDTGGNGAILVDEDLGIRGKPDEIWKLKDGTCLVVEHKSSVLKNKLPYPGDRLQLAAYLLLVEKYFQTYNLIGEIRYRNRTFQLKWTPALKRQLTRVIRQMRQGERTEETTVNVYLPKCMKCQFYKVSCLKA